MDRLKAEWRSLKEFEERAHEAFGKIVEARDALHDLLDEGARLQDWLTDDELTDRLAGEASHIDLAHDALWLAYNIYDEVGV